MNRPMMYTSFLTAALLLLTLPATTKAQTWNQITKSVAGDRYSHKDGRVEGVMFGYEMDISGNYAIIGTHYESGDLNGNNAMNRAGAAYIYKQSGGVWVPQQKLVAPDRAAEDFFGWSVAISGDYAIVGAQQEDEDASGTNTLNYAGSAY